MNTQQKTTTTTFAVWYMRTSWFTRGIFGEHPDAAKLDATHVHLKDVELSGGQAQLDRVFHMMQAEEWSPNGEAVALIEEKGLGHTSMSVGDVIVVDGQAFMVASFGFDQLKPGVVP
jgi:hypothetical protein